MFHELMNKPVLISISLKFLFMYRVTFIYFLLYTCVYIRLLGPRDEATGLMWVTIQEG